jgi:hypothetical protein
MGKRLTTEGFAASANSVITVWISSRRRRPLEVLEVDVDGSAAFEDGVGPEAITTASAVREHARRR